MIEVALALVAAAALAGVHAITPLLHRLPDRHQIVLENAGAGAGLAYVSLVLVEGGLVEEAGWGPLNLGFYVLALGIHLLFNDVYLQHIYPHAHGGRLRALLAAGPVIGAAAVVALAVPVGVLYAVLAWIAGGTLIHVFRRELPGVGSVRPLAFVVGAVLYAVLVFATWRF